MDLSQESFARLKFDNKSLKTAKKRLLLRVGNVIPVSYTHLVKSAPIYPEFSVNWILDEVQNHPFEEREHDQFYLRNEKEKQEILDLCSWWKGRTLDDYINVRLDDDQLKGCLLYTSRCV